MANLNVAYDDMTSAANRLTAGKEDIASKLTDLQTLVTNLVNGGFITDSASGAFHTSYENFTKGANQAIGGLDGMSQFLTSAVHAMQGMDQQLAKGIQG
jgi:uncharacterized protein YukE